MDWARAIELNHTKLARIVAELIAMVEITVNGAVSNLIYRAVLRVLHPAESAVRRLIIIAARGTQVKLPPSRPMPKGRVIAGKDGGGRISFQLFDTRKRFDFGPPRKPYAKAHPRVGPSNPIPRRTRSFRFFCARPDGDRGPVRAVPEPVPKRRSLTATARTQSLLRRLAAMKYGAR